MGSIAFVNCCLPPPAGKPFGAPLGVLSLATYLKKQGKSSRIYDTALDFSADEFTWERLTDYLCAIPEKILCCSLWDTVLPKFVLASRALKERCPEKVVVVGGPAPSVIGREMLSAFPWIDFAVVGEGERALDSLLDCIVGGWLGPADLPDRVLIRDRDQVVKGAANCPYLTPKEIPLPDYSLLNEQYNKAEILTSRGCPHSCSFCSVNNTWGKSVRFRPEEDVFAEVANHLTSSGFSEIHFMDDNFGTDKRRLKSISSYLSTNHPRKIWSCYFRLSDMTPENIDMMAEAGCRGLFVGIESGDEDKLREYGKHHTGSEILRRLSYASRKMRVITSFIWGMPDETLAHLHKTLRLIDSILDLDNLFVNIYQLAPLSGTAIERQTRHLLRFSPEITSEFVYPPHSPKLTVEEKDLIRGNPLIFSSYYYPHSGAFLEKRQLVDFFLSK